MYVCLRRRSVLIALCTALVLCASRVHAQTVVDARRVEFLPSPDHDALTLDGAPVVEHYSIEIYVAGARWPAASAELDKPATDPDGVIRVDFTNEHELSAPLVAGLTYEAVVYAVGAAGRSDGARSPVFSVAGVVQPPPPPPPPAPCSYVVTPTSLQVGWTKSMSIVTVTTQAGCAWTAGGGSNWVTMSAAGTGSGVVTI